MTPTLLWYPPCGTCRKAVRWLDEHGVAVTRRDIVECPPDVVELETWIARTPAGIRRFFNTSGLRYRELKLSERLGTMTEREMIGLLAGDGKLIRRPLLVTEDTVLVGFDAEEWERNLLR